MVVGARWWMVVVGARWWMVVVGDGGGWWCWMVVTPISTMVVKRALPCE